MITEEEMLEPVLRPQVTLRELLQDPVYKKWFKLKPKPKHNAKWRVYVQLEADGPWRKRDFDRWVDAYNFLAKNIKKFHDAALSCRNWPSVPPVVRDPNNPSRRRYYHAVLSLIDHHWCGYCRRPTVMRVFGHHHNVGKCLAKPRCTICGHAEDGLKIY